MRPGRGAAVFAPDEDAFFPSLLLPLVARPPPPRDELSLIHISEPTRPY